MFVYGNSERKSKKHKNIYHKNNDESLGILNLKSYISIGLW